MEVSKKQPSNRNALNSKFSINTHYLWLAALAPAFFAFACYLPVLNNQFVNFDDPVNILDNPNIRGLSPETIRMMFTNFHVGYWIPLTWFSFAIDFQIGKFDPRIYHFHSLVLHCFNTILVYFLCRRILNLNQKSNGPNNPEISTGWQMPSAFLAALLFGLHPIHVESVAWATERRDVLYSFYYLLSLLLYLSFAQKTKNKFLTYTLCLFLFLLAAMAKPMAVSLPLVLLIFDFWPLNRFSFRSFGIFLEKIPFLFGSLAATGLTILAHSEKGYISTLEILPLDYRIMNSFHSIIFYLIKMVAPTGLMVLYPIILSKTFSIGYLASALFVIVISIFLFNQRRSRPYLWAGWLFYLASLLPSLGFFQAGDQTAGDRYTYLASMSPFLLTASFIGILFYKRPALFKAITGGLILVLGFTTHQQLKTWKDSVSLWENEVKFSAPYVYDVVYENLGDAYMAEGRWDDVIKTVDSAMGTNLLLKSEQQTYLSSKNDKGHSYLSIQAILHQLKGLAFLKKNLPTDASREFELEISLDPQNAMGHRLLSYADVKLGDNTAALTEILEAIRLNPNMPGVYKSLGVIYFSMKQYEKAAEAFDKAHLIDPQDLEDLMNLAAAYTFLGRTRETIQTLKTASALQPQNPEIVRQLGLAYQKEGQREVAAQYFEMAKNLAEHSQQ